MESTTQKPRYLVLATCLTLFALLAQASESGATTFSVSPTRIDLKASMTSSLITVVNTGVAAARFQVSAYAWDQSVDGSMRLEETRAIVFYPPLVEIGPGDSKRIRVGTTLPFGRLEQTFRLFVEELPNNVEQAPELGVHVRARMGIPIFVGGVASPPAAILEDVTVADGHVSLRLRNAGSVHLGPPSVLVTGLSASNTVVFEQQIPAWYLLAQHALSLSADVDCARCAGVSQLQIVARFEGGFAATSRVPAAGRFCGGQP